MIFHEARYRHVISQTEICSRYLHMGTKYCMFFVIFGAGLASMLGPVLLSKDLEAIELLKDADIGPLVPVSSCFY